MRKLPSLPWLALIGLIILIKALILSLMISGIIASNVAEVTGVDGDRVRVSGLNTTIDGFTDQASADEAEQIARDDVAWTSDVVTVVSEPEQLGVAVTELDVTLTGVVRNEGIKTVLVAAAEEEFGSDRTVVDQLEIDSEVPADGGELIVTGNAPDTTAKQEWVAGGQVIAAAGGMTVVDDVVAEPQATVMLPAGW